LTVQAGLLIPQAGQRWSSMTVLLQWDQGTGASAAGPTVRRCPGRVKRLRRGVAGREAWPGQVRVLALSRVLAVR
jgi:hypothetical protein